MQKGEKIGCFGLTEPDFGSNPGGMRTRAKKSGKEYVLNGEKMWITSGSIADVAIIWAKAEDEDNKIRGFLVETDRPGFRAEDIHGKWSLRASVTSSLSLQDVHIPESNLLPKTGGLKSPLMCLSQARYGIGWGAIGAAMACYDCALQYSLFRKQFHDQPIASHQLVQEKLAWMISEITKAQLLALQVGRLKDKDKAAPAAYFHVQAKQCLDGAGMRPHGPRHPGRQRHRRRVSHLPPHGEPGVGEDLRRHSRHSHPDHRAERDRHRRVLVRVGRTLLSAAFDFDFELRELVQSRTFVCRVKIKSKAADKSVRTHSPPVTFPSQPVGGIFVDRARVQLLSIRGHS